MTNLFTLHQGDCLETLRGMADCSVDAVVTDPPYELTAAKRTKPAPFVEGSPFSRHRVGVNGDNKPVGGFMGNEWDGTGIAFKVELWAEVLRVLKPGGHLLAFSGTRTYHRMGCAIEDAGFEIRDQIQWIFGSGFPKSRNIAADMGQEDAATWSGWGTALKPANEPICVARKPLAPGCTVAVNVLQHGTGALNIDGCRVSTDGEQIHAPQSDPLKRSGVVGSNLGISGADREAFQAAQRASIERTMTMGRWPANLIHDGSDEVVAGFPDSNGSGPARKLKRGQRADGEGWGMADQAGELRDAGTGSAARFFLQCKGGYNELWQDLNLPPENANTAEQSSSQQRQAAVSALVLAVNLALPEGLYCSNLYLGPSTHATGSELKLIADSVTQTIQTIGPRFWLGSRPARLSLSLNHASVAVSLEQTGTMTITASRWKSDGFAEDVTFNITPTSLEAGEKDCEQSTDGKRFIYCAKASKADRGADNIHPTVKPTDLMAYLVRLVTPPGGVVLDPFMGSGSTGKAAMREGMRFIGCELSDEYLSIARARIEHEAARIQAERQAAEKAATPSPQFDLFAS